jgi:CDP-diacylglycerol---glycerol-3-phosphate 3-phosphatidyltransferase
MVSNLARAWSARFVQGIARVCSNLGLTPNAVTVLGFILTAMVAGVLAMGQTQLAGGLLIVTLGIDAIDGTLARISGTTSRFGAFLDSTLDRWAEVLIYFALVWLFLREGNQEGVLLSTAAMASSLLVSYTRARAEGVGLVCKGGLLTRFERLLLLIVGLLVRQIVIALWIVAVLAALTALQRIWVTWQADRATQRT